MRKFICVLSLGLLSLAASACSQTPIIGDQLSDNATQLLQSGEKLNDGCKVVTTVTTTPSKWSSIFGLDQTVTSSVECKQ